MTEEEFIKNYFSKKRKTVNESVGSTIGAIGDVIGIPIPGELIDAGLIALDSTVATKPISDFLDKKVKSQSIIDKIQSNFSKSASKPKTKAEKKDRDDKLKLTGTISNNGNLYLKYFLITFTLHCIEKKELLNETKIKSIYNEIENNKYDCPITGESFAGSVVIITKAKINNKKIDEDFFYEMLNEIFITNPNKSQYLYNIINSVLKTTTVINQPNINDIFKRFYQEQSIKYKIG
jgi:hypothetical protein